VPVGSNKFIFYSKIRIDSIRLISKKILTQSFEYEYVIYIQFDTQRTDTIKLKGKKEMVYICISLNLYMS
jgi:hypothetical protein